MQVLLFYLAHSRTGDKGNSQTMSLIPYEREDYALLAQAVTPDVVKRHFGPLVEGKIHRYALPLLAAFNFVLEDALQGGVNDSLALDTHGKSRSSVFLALEIDVRDDHPASRRYRAEQEDRNRGDDAEHLARAGYRSARLGASPGGDPGAAHHDRRADRPQRG